MITRRGFLAGALAALLAPRRIAAAALERRQGTYTARVSLLYGVLRFEIAGTIEESIDREAARYEVRLHGQGSGIENRLESRGTLRRDRWTPDHVRSRFVVHGRESWVDVDRVLRLHEQGMRREACALDLGRFNRVRHRLHQRYGWT